MKTILTLSFCLGAFWAMAQVGFIDATNKNLLKPTLTIGYNHGDYHCEPAELEIVDTVYFEGKRFGGYVEDNPCFAGYGTEGKYLVAVPYYSHEWTYKDQAALTMFPFIHAPSYSAGCPTVYVSDYERICERCLRHEYHREVQHYQKVKKEESKFEQLKGKIKQ